VRKEKITVQAYNLAGEEVSGELDGLFARVVQHEVDHLDGRLFIDRLSPTQYADIAGALEEFEIDFNSKRAVGEMPSEETVAAHLEQLERLRT
jgi:peptide deformylase